MVCSSKTFYFCGVIVTSQDGRNSDRAVSNSRDLSQYLKANHKEENTTIPPIPHHNTFKRLMSVAQAVQNTLCEKVNGKKRIKTCMLFLYFLMAVTVRNTTCTLALAVTVKNTTCTLALVVSHSLAQERKQ